ncbi:MAG TPA: S-methyl-5'-thioadenosine phosphorylase [Acidimicrobiales bacterium]|nr:S-methyl-5'-thioadenosine phosphorylase [Acidimicrobiales bacterium]
MSPAPISAEIGVFGGSGFYAFLDDVVEVAVHTPYGAPSAPVAVGTVADRRVAFLPRHGAHHELPPHRVDFRANVWALHSLGVTRVIGPCAAGSLRSDRRPGEVVVLDQLVDRTSGRSRDTFFDGGVAGHVSFSDPYCGELAPFAVAAARSSGVTVHDGGTVVVVPGPRFSTRAESAYFARQGWDVINMTQYPEAYLCRELGLCYCGMALVTDFDNLPGESPVRMDEVFRVLRSNVDRTRSLLFELIPRIPAQRTPSSCACASALDQGPLGS